MIQYKKHILKNGLRVILHQDESTPVVAVNLIYDVGARDEDSNKTGFDQYFYWVMRDSFRRIWCCCINSISFNLLYNTFYHYFFFQ